MRWSCAWLPRTRPAIPAHPRRTQRTRLPDRRPGLGIDGEEALEAGLRAAADGIDAFSDEDVWDVLEGIPNGSAAAVVLLEPHWAIPLRDAVMAAAGYRISAGFIGPLDLIGIGLVTVEEARALQVVETAALGAG